MNNLEVVTTTSEMYADVFGFTFGSKTDIYNPWSILNFLGKKKFSIYWANTSSNSFAGKLIREGSKDVKIIMENLLKGETLCTEIDEQIVFIPVSQMICQQNASVPGTVENHLANKYAREYNQLDCNEYAIWSLLLASGYLKVEEHIYDADSEREEYRLKLTNNEVRIMFQNMIQGWFKQYSPAYNDLRFRL